MKSWKLFCAATLVAGVATIGSQAQAQDRPAADPALCDAATSNNDLAADSRLLSEMLDVRECWPANGENGAHYYLNDFYTRWVIEEVANTPPNMPRYYSGEKHSVIERFFLGRTRNTAITVKIKMRDPDIEFTIPLITLDYSGKRGEGQTFTTLLTRSNMSLPDFRISPSTSASVDAIASASNQVDFHGAGAILSTLQDALSIVSPGSTLLNSQNREQVQRLSTAYDATLSKLLSSNITETVTSGRMLSQWQSRRSFLITVHVPHVIKTGRDASSAAQEIERTITFRVGMACPRLSIFDSLNLCEMTGRGGDLPLISSPYPAAGADPVSEQGWPGTRSARYLLAVARLRERISPHQVLSFRLSEGKTLRQFLTEQEWFISLSKGLVTALPQTNADAATAAAHRDSKSPAAAPPPAQAAAEGVGADAVAPPAADGPAKRPPDDVRDKTDQANQLCETITDKLYATGLSHLDANIGLWAVITGMPDFTNAKGLFQNAPACREHMPAGPAKGVWRYEEEPVPDQSPPRRAARPKTKKK